MDNSYSPVMSEISLQLYNWQQSAVLVQTKHIYFLTLLVAFCLLLGLFQLPIFSFIEKDTKSATKGRGRIERLDALRALAALAVMFHHAGRSSFYFFNSPGKWQTWPGVATTMGDFGVCLFFMLSAFLFSSKTYESKESWTRFYIGRFFRIMPAAYCAALICFAVSLYFSLYAPPLVAGERVFSLSETLSCFLDWMIAPFGQYPAPGRDNPALINCGVLWTLRWEWLLYLMLPFLIFLRDKASALAVGTALIVLGFTNDAGSLLYEALMCFGLGFVASFVYGQKLELNKKILDIAALILVVFFFLDGWQRAFYTPHLNMLCGGFFLCVVLGADFFGFFRWKSIQRIGEVSFSLYLIHGLFFYLGGKLLSPKSTVYPSGFLEIFGHLYNLNNGLVFLIYHNMLFLLAAVSASLFYAFIESPFMRLGRRVSGKILPLG